MRDTHACWGYTGGSVKQNDVRFACVSPMRESRFARAHLRLVHLGVRLHTHVAHARKGGRQVNSERTRAQATAAVESMLGSLS